jgi:hypothetical protein
MTIPYSRELPGVLMDGVVAINDLEASADRAQGGGAFR